MKKLIVAIIIIVTFSLISCEPTATFDKPQPDNVKSQASFPERLHGEYLAVDKASIVTITDTLITRCYNFDYKDHKDNLDSTYKISGDTLINLHNGTKEKILIESDTVIQHANWIDTLFNLSADNIFKKFKGHYFLNYRYDSNSWEVKELSLKKGILTFGGVSEKDGLQKLKEITETSADTISTHFNLTKRQFKTFIGQKGFGEKETFIRIQKNDIQHTSL